MANGVTILSFFVSEDIISQSTILLETSSISLMVFQQAGNFCESFLQFSPLGSVCLSEISPK
jgi:hypothetical protein